MSGMLQVGIDIGSTTIKTVVLNAQGRICHKQYARHFSDIEGAFRRELEGLWPVLGDKAFSLALTGSAGMGIAERLGLSFVQEVMACVAAVRRFLPEAETVIELGGEDAKITWLGRAMEQRMNGVCAGGTGAFIDHMASLLGTDAAGLDRMAAAFSNLHPIASRCGVFAKTDVQLSLIHI